MGIAASRLQPFLLSIDHRKNWFIDIVRLHVLVGIRDGLRCLTVTRDDIKIVVEKCCYRVRILQKRSCAVQDNLSMADAYDHMVNGNRGDAGMNMDFDRDFIVHVALSIENRIYHTLI
jgi:hypothetical protein